MDSNGWAGVFLTLDDCKVLFPRLKEKEPYLAKDERAILLKLEKVLYGSLSVTEIEELFIKAAPVSPGSGNV